MDFCRFESIYKNSYTNVVKIDCKKTKKRGEKMDVETIAMTLIAHSGDARADAFRALSEVKKGNYEKAGELLEKAERSSVEAHKVQTELLVGEANGEKTEINVLLIHSQDHLMTSMLALELIKEIIVLHKEKADR